MPKDLLKRVMNKLNLDKLDTVLGGGKSVSYTHLSLEITSETKGLKVKIKSAKNGEKEVNFDLTETPSPVGLSQMDFSQKMCIRDRLTTNLINFERTDVYSSELFIAQYDLKSYLQDVWIRPARSSTSATALRPGRSTACRTAKRCARA